MLGNQDSGLRIEGPPTAAAVLDGENWTHSYRAGVFRYTYVVELQNADDVTFDHLQVTGSQYGLYAGPDSDSDHLTVSNSAIWGNTRYGLVLYASNDFAVIRDSTFYGIPGGSELDNQVYGVQFYGNDVQISGNTIRDDPATRGLP